MSQTKQPAATQEARAEIERRVEALAGELAAELGPGRDGRPRWIEPAELVRRMRPFLSGN